MTSKLKKYRQKWKLTDLLQIFQAKSWSCLYFSTVAPLKIGIYDIDTITSISSLLCNFIVFINLLLFRWILISLFIDSACAFWVWGKYLHHYLLQWLLMMQIFLIHAQELYRQNLQWQPLGIYIFNKCLRWFYGLLSTGLGIWFWFIKENKLYSSLRKGFSPTLFCAPVLPPQPYRWVEGSLEYKWITHLWVGSFKYLPPSVLLSLETSTSKSILIKNVK